MFYATTYKPGLVLALYSLVSTGTNCRIILFVASDFSAKASFFEFAQRYAVEIVEHCDATSDLPPFGHMLRYEYEEMWLQENAQDVDRVIHCDSYDVFFQADPFQDVIPFDRLLLVREELLIAHCDWNSQWMKECYGRRVWEAIKDNNVICTGLIAGNAGEYRRLLSLMRARPEWQFCWDTSKDQPILNRLLWTGVFKENKFLFDYTDCHHGIFTMHWCQGDEPIQFNTQNLLATPQDDVPFLLHQYNRYQTAIDHLAEQCGIGSFPHV
jgi:hypothetical protein